MRGSARGYHTVVRSWSLLCLSTLLVCALFILSASKPIYESFPNSSSQGAVHDPILVMRLLRPILVRIINTVFDCLPTGIIVNVYLVINSVCFWSRNEYFHF